MYESKSATSERVKTGRVRVALENALSPYNKRFEYLDLGNTAPSLQDRVSVARAKWEARRNWGIRGEIIAPVVFANMIPRNMYPEASSNVYLARRAKDVKRRLGDGTTIMKKVLEDEGGGMLVLHPMGGVSSEDFDAVAKLESTKLGVHSVLQCFEGVLLSGAFMHETQEEIDPTAAWNKGILRIIHRIFIYEPYFDTQTKMLIYPMACELKKGIPHFKGDPDQLASQDPSRLGYDPETIFENYVRKSSEYPEVEYDIVTGAGSNTGFHQFTEIAQMVTERPSDFYPGTIKALTEVLKDEWKHPRVGPQTVTIWDVPNIEK